MNRFRFFCRNNVFVLFFDTGLRHNAFRLVVEIIIPENLRIFYLGAIAVVYQIIVLYKVAAGCNVIIPVGCQVVP